MYNREQYALEVAAPSMEINYMHRYIVGEKFLCRLRKYTLHLLHFHCPFRLFLESVAIARFSSLIVTDETKLSSRENICSCRPKEA